MEVELVDAMEIEDMSEEGVEGEKAAKEAEEEQEEESGGGGEEKLGKKEVGRGELNTGAEERGA